MGLFAAAQASVAKDPAVAATKVPGRLADFTDKVGVHFQQVASYTSRKQLIETTGCPAHH
jgi:hypothetical protein